MHSWLNERQCKKHSIYRTYFTHCTDLAWGLFKKAPDVSLRNIFLCVWWQMPFEITKYVIAGFAICNQEIQFVSLKAKLKGKMQTLNMAMEMLHVALPIMKFISLLVLQNKWEIHFPSYCQYKFSLYMLQFPLLNENLPFTFFTSDALTMIFFTYWSYRCYFGELSQR